MADQPRKRANAEPSPAASPAASPAICERAARTVVRALGEHDMDLLDSVQQPDVVLDVTGLHLECRGRAAVRAFLRELYDAIPDYGMAVTNVTASDRFAAAQWTSWGTFTGRPFQGILATGRPVDLRGVVWSTVVDGLVSEHTVYYDGADFARQVGLLPPLHGRAERAMFAAFNTGTRLRHVLRERPRRP